MLLFKDDDGNSTANANNTSSEPSVLGQSEDSPDDILDKLMGDDDEEEDATASGSDKPPAGD